MGDYNLVRTEFTSQLKPTFKKHSLKKQLVAINTDLQYYGKYGEKISHRDKIGEVKGILKNGS